jgi:ligand-binding sensor domain-containing protein
VNKKTIIALLVTLCNLIAADSISQPADAIKPDQYRAINWSMEEGLPGKLANVMIKDTKGFLWVGNGELSRFDGVQFKKFIPDQHKRGAINSGGITAFVEDSLDNIWIGTEKGLSRYDMKADTFTNFLPLIDSASSGTRVLPFWATKEEVFCMEPGLWITSYNVGSPVRKKLWQLSQEDKVGNYDFRTIYSIFDAGSNSIWILPIMEHGLLQISLKDGQRKPYTWPCNKNRAKEHRDGAEAMQLDRKRNSIWINSGDGLLEFTLADKQFHHMDAFNELVKLKDYDRYVGLDIDMDGRIWLATKPKGILIYDPKTEQVTRLFSDPDLQQQIGEGVLHIYCDRDGIVWVSDYVEKGVYELLPFNPPIKQYVANPQLQNSLSNNTVLTIIPAAQGKMWIGTNDGLNIFDPLTEKFEVLREKDLPGIKGKVIAPLYIDTILQKAWLSATGSSELYWWMDMYEMNIKTRKCRPIVFRDGTKLMDRDTLNIGPLWVWPYKKGLMICDELHGIFEIKEGSLFADLLIPFNASLSRFVLVEDRFIFLRSHLPNFNFENKNGEWTRIAHLLDSLEWISFLNNEKDHTNWVSLKNELVHYDKEFRKIKTYGQADGYDGAMNNMLTDNSGNLWFINVLNQLGSLNTTTGIISTLSEADGYQKQNFAHHTPSAKDAQGNLYFGASNTGRTTGGLDRVYPEKYSSAATSSVYFRSLTINQKPFPLTIGVNNLEELSLRYNENTLSIEAGIIDFYAKGKGRIRYKLQENDKEGNWQFDDAYATIRYEKLPPGRYELVLQATNTGNEFNSAEKKLVITISSPFWQTWWFRILAIVTAAALLYGFIKYRSRQLKARNILLEKKIVERTNELNHSLPNLKPLRTSSFNLKKWHRLVN